MLHFPRHTVNENPCLQGIVGARGNALLQLPSPNLEVQQIRLVIKLDVPRLPLHGPLVW